MTYSNLDVSELFVDQQGQRSSMHTRHLNEQLVRVLKTIDYDVGFQKGQGQYLFDREGARYLDLTRRVCVFCDGAEPSCLASGAQERARQRPSKSRAARRVDTRRYPGRATAQIC